MKKLLSTILALALALTLVFALVSCGCDEHVDSDNDGKCDECEADYCATHVDADRNGICDHGSCGAAVPCTQHIDSDGDRICDVPNCGAFALPDPCANGSCADVNKDGICDACKNDVEIFAANIFEMIEDSDPTKITTIHSTSVDEVPYVSVYTTTIYAENHFSHEYEITVPAPIGSAEATEIEEGVIVYNNGVYTLNGEEVVGAAPEVEYLGVKMDLTPANVLAADDSNATISNTGVLTLVLTSEMCEKAFGIEVDADEITVEVTNNGLRLSKIVISYVENGATVTVETSYSYEPVTAPQA